MEPMEPPLLPPLSCIVAEKNGTVSTGLLVGLPNPPLTAQLTQQSLVSCAFRTHNHTAEVLTLENQSARLSAAKTN